MSWLDDPKLARRLARATWVILVATFVVATRYSFEAWIRHIVVAVLLAVVVVFNAPVVVGLHKSRSESGTTAFKLVAASLIARIGATAWVVWMLTQ
jgi:hypothetical protein